MPPVVAAVAAVGSAVAGAFGAAGAAIGAVTASSALAATVFTAFKQIAIGVALSLLSRALAPRPETGQQTSRGTKISITTGEDQPQSFIFGTFVTAGDLVYHGSFGEVDDTPNAFYVQVIELSDIPAFMASHRVWVNGAWCRLGRTAHPKRGYPVPHYRKDGDDHLWVKFHSGNQTTADPFLVEKFASDLPEDTNLGDRYFIVADSAPTGEPGWERTPRITGTVWLDSDDDYRPRVFNSTNETWQTPNNLVHGIETDDTQYWVFEETHQGETRRVNIYVSENQPGLTTFNPLNIWFWRNTDRRRTMFWDGDTWSEAGSAMDEIRSTNTDRPWQTDMIGRGVAYAVVTSLFNPEVHTGGRPQLRFELLSRWYDRRRDSTAGGSGAQRYRRLSTRRPSRNPIVGVENVLRGVLDPISGEHMWGGHSTDRELPASVWIAGMNTCDELLGGAASFEAGLEIRVDEEPASIIEEFLRSCAGQIAWTGTAWNLSVGRPASPVYSFTDDDVIVTAAEVLNPFPGLDEAFNEITAQYPEPSIGYGPRDAPPRREQEYLDADLGRRNIANVQYLAVTRNRQVQRLMRSTLRDSRRFIRHAPVVLPPEAIILSPLDEVSWTSARYGYINKIFTVDLVQDLPNGNVAVSLRERNPSDYDWSQDLELPVAVTDAVPRVRRPRQPSFQVRGSTIRAKGIGRRASILLTWKIKRTAKRVRFRVRLGSDRSHVPVDYVAGSERSSSRTRVLAVGGRKLTAGGAKLRVVNTVRVRLGTVEIYGGGIMPDETYQVDVAYDDDPWPGTWLGVTTPDVRIDRVDLTPEIQQSLTAPSAPSDSAWNLVPDENFQLSTWWTGGSQGYEVRPVSNHPTAISIGELRWSAANSPATPPRAISRSKNFGVQPGQRLRWRIQSQKVNGDRMHAVLRMIFFSKDGTVVDSNIGPLVNIDVTGATLQSFSGTVANVPAGAFQACLHFEIVKANTPGVVRFFSPMVADQDVNVVATEVMSPGTTTLVDGAGYTLLESRTIAKSVSRLVKIFMVAKITGSGDVTYRLKRGADVLYEGRDVPFWVDDDTTVSETHTYTWEAKADGANASLGRRLFMLEQIL